MNRPLFDIIRQEHPFEGLEDLQNDFLADRKSEASSLAESSNIDFETIRKLAHNWRGSSEPYGFKYLGELATELEKSAMNLDRNACLRQIDQVQKYLQAKEEVLESNQI